MLSGTGYRDPAISTGHSQRMPECRGHGSYTAPVNYLREKHCEMRTDTDMLVANTCDRTQGSKLLPQDRSIHTGCFPLNNPLFTQGDLGVAEEIFRLSVNYH